MKTVAFILISTASLGMAQHRAGGGGPVGHGFGNVVFPGTGIPQVGGHIPALGAAVRGVYPAAPPMQQQRGPGMRRAVPVAVPIYVGGYGYGYGYNGYGYDYSQQQQQQPNVTVVNAPQPSPTVIINQNYAPDQAHPVMREYANGELPDPAGVVSSYQAPVPSHPNPPKPAASANDDTPTVYLIALKDGTVYSAYAYWLEADTLHYITTKHSHNRASLGLVDETLSAQLNRERSVEWKVRAPK